jgi:AcrR family transcriptional regulator
MTPRLSAEERRDEIVAAAAIEFAQAGYAGTPTEAIARRVGVSQPYLFQLFGTKRDLFVAAINDCFGKTRRNFVEAGRAAREQGLDTKATLEEIGHAYVRLLMRDPNLLRLQLQGYAAAGTDTDIRAAVRRNYHDLWTAVAEVSCASREELTDWFAMGMLINVVASIGTGLTFEDYMTSLLGGVPESCE